MRSIHAHLLTATSAAALTALFAAPQGFVFTDEHHAILRHMELIDLPDGRGGSARTLRITGANVQLVNGLGSTTGNPDQPSDIVTNGLGNLIVGYNEPFGGPAHDRTGSHNLIVGARHSFTGVGGAAIGWKHEIHGQWSSAFGGTNNDVDGSGCTIVGGSGSDAFGVACVVAGGLANHVGHNYATVVGGEFNSAEFWSASVFGGKDNRITGEAYYGAIVGGQANDVGNGAGCLVAGGKDNLAQGSGAFVGGGIENLAQSFYATVVGGFQNRALYTGSVFGGRQNQAGDFVPDNSLNPTVVGGRGNFATADGATVGGGRGRTADGEDDWVAGSLFEDH